MEEWKNLLDKERLTGDERKKLCNLLMTTESRMETLVIKYFEAKDFKNVSERRIGTGLIGGKACGLLVSRKIIEKNLPEHAQVLEPHHSFFIASGVFLDYIEDNGCMELREKMKEEKEKFQELEMLKYKLRHGKLRAEILDELRKIIREYKNTPMIIRSSSFLEDGYGNAFSGKYESIFCTNQGSEEENLQEFVRAIRKVYASTVNPGAIEYRRKRGLLGADEQMALLVQRVAGADCGGYYFPAAAGMGCSYNPYKWMEHLNPDAGMLRMVAGLGTRAVERTPGDYPRLVGLDRPKANMRTTIAERHKFSQRQVDVLDLKEGKITAKPLREIIPLLDEWKKKMILSRDTDAEYILAQRRDYRKVYFADCEGFVEQEEFIEPMKKILKTLEKAYLRPVDIEFAVTERENGHIGINLLQCRPLQKAVSEKISIPEGVENEILFDVRRTSMRRSKTEKLEYIVRVDPQNYYDHPYAEKFQVARMISKINQYFEEEDKKAMLLVPGRIGTSSPELGVPVVYADISQFIAICEVAYGKAGYHPDLSYGSHMFQDMVEADVYYGAINENSKTKIYQPGLLKKFPNVFGKLWEGETDLSGIIEVYDVSEINARLILDAREGRAVCRLTEILEEPIPL